MPSNAENHESNASYGTIIIERPPRRLTRRSRCSPWLICFAALLFGVGILLILALCLFYLSLLYAFCPFQNPLCWKYEQPHWQRPSLINETFAVGFHLSAGYATAAISFRNGTTRVLGRVEGDVTYKDVLKRASLQESTHPTPPYYGRGADSDSWRQWQRWWRKRHRQPSSEDVAVLAQTIERLQIQANEALEALGPFQYATIVPPQLPAIYNEDLVDVAEYLGFQFIQPIKKLADVAHIPNNDVNTAYAGMGLGFCRFPEGDQSRCEDCGGEEGDVLVVSYTDDALTTHVAAAMCPSAWYAYYASGVANFELGRGAMDTTYASAEEYWNDVGENMTAAFDTYSWRAARLKRVVVHGESAADRDFNRILRDRVKSYQNEGWPDPEYFSTQPEFAGGIGAAEMALKCMLSGQDCIPDLRPSQQGW